MPSPGQGKPRCRAAPPQPRPTPTTCHPRHQPSMETDITQERRSPGRGPAVIPRAVCAEFVIDPYAAGVLACLYLLLSRVEVQVGGEHGRSPPSAPRRRAQGPVSRPVPRSDSGSIGAGPATAAASALRAPGLWATREWRRGRAPSTLVWTRGCASSHRSAGPARISARRAAACDRGA
jgi:hypothetical protein